MSSRRVLPYLALVSTSALLLACPPDEPGTPLAQPRTVTSSELLRDANTNLRTHLMGSEQAVAAIDFEALFGQITPDAPPCLPEEPCEDPQPIDLSIDGAQLADMMAAEVLNAANTEASSPTSLTLRFDDAMCPADSESGQRDPDCVSAAQQMQPRLHLTSLSPGDVSLKLQMGAARAEFARLELFRAHLAVEIDLGAAKAGLEALANTLPDVPPEALAALRAATVQGRLRAEVGPGAGQIYAARLAVLSPVVIETQIEGESIALHVAAANPALELGVDPATQTMTLDLTSGGFDFTGPFNLFNGSASEPTPCTVGPNGETNCDEPVEPEPLTGSLQIVTPASTARLLMTGSEQLHIENISTAGPALAKLDGRTLINATLGAVNGGAFALDMQDSADNVLFTVSPSARFVVEMDLVTLAEQVQVPSWMLNERLEVKMDGDAAPTLAIEHETGRMRMAQGRLTIDSRAANRQIVVNAGQCLNGTETEPSSEDAHPLEVIEAGACN